MTDNIRFKEGIPEHVQFAKLDLLAAVQDYAPRRLCLRLTGISPQSFEESDFNSAEGCETFVIDIAYVDLHFLKINGDLIDQSGLLPRILGMTFPYYDYDFDWPWPCHWCFEHLPPSSLLEEEIWPDFLWLKVEYVPTSDSALSYSYAMFGSQQPTYVELRRIEVVQGKAIAPVPSSDASQELELTSSEQWELMSFHVGQGMCSLLKGSQDGLLLDVGAGTPVTRPTYQSGIKPDSTNFKNDLFTETTNLSLDVIVSHPDSDHWRTLQWDAEILDKVKNIYLPAGVSSLSLNSKGVKSKIIGIGNELIVSINPSGHVRIYRSRPTFSDKNGECLVTEVKINRKRALFPGDYAYSRMHTDGNICIKNLATASFDAVIVPHHGDKPSANVLVCPQNPRKSVAFFSAGTHAGYGHPTRESLGAHKKSKFAVIDKHSLDDIIKRKLF